VRARDRTAAIDDRRVVELVAEHDVALTGERADDAEVRQVTRAEQQRALGALELGQRLLEAPVHGHRARDEPRRARPDAPAHRRLGRRLTHARVIGQPEVVVRAEQQDGLAVEHDPGTLGPGDQPHPPRQAEGGDLVEPLLEVHRQCPNGMPESWTGSSGFSSGHRFGAPSGRSGTAFFFA
jgi:hypothetical protein